MRFRFVASVCLVMFLGGGFVLADSSDLSNGVFIAHALANLQYTSDPPAGGWCGAYDEYAAIASCSEQINRIDSEGPVVWYVLAAWTESKEWCGAQFGFGDYDAGDFVIVDHGACFPSSGLKIPTSGWPGPNEGIALTTTDESWEGNFRPVYWIAGYAYGEDVIPLGPNPDLDSAGWASCEDQQEVGATALGGMGLFTDGIYACPEGGEQDDSMVIQGAFVEDLEASLVIEEVGDDLQFDLGGGAPRVSIVEVDGERTVLEVTVGEFQVMPVDIEGDTYYEISLEGESVWGESGLPALPRLARSLIIPDDQHMSLSIIGGTYVDVPDLPVAPSRGPLPYDSDPASEPYTFGPPYSADAFWPESVAQLTDPYILRDFRGITVGANCFRYNPATRTLRVLTSLTIEIQPDGPDSVNVLDRSLRGSRLCTDFLPTYRSHFLNFDVPRLDPIPEDGTLLIIAADQFVAAMEPFQEWKMQRGLETILTPLSEIAESATDTTSIKNYIADQYGSNNVSFVLLVGDAEQLAPLRAWAVPSILPEAVSDSRYALVDGNDSYADLFMGRFSAEDSADAATQVDRTLFYERDVCSNAAWAKAAMGCAGDITGHTPDESNFMHIASILDQLVQYGFAEHDLFSFDTATAEDLSDALEDGRGVVVYSGHGGRSAWEVGPFTSGDVEALENAGKLPFIHAVGCEMGHFNDYTCFGEAWLRSRTSGGLPIGAVAAFMQSRTIPGCGIVQDAQDAAIDLLTEGATGTLGGLLFGGCNYMLEQDEQSLWSTGIFASWVNFGDPSLMVRSAEPTAFEVSHAGVLFKGQAAYDVVLSEWGDAGSRCTLYSGTERTIYGSALADAGGTAHIPLNPELPASTLTLTVTGSNRITYQDDVYPVLVVLENGQGDCPNIKAAVNAAVDGTIILVGNGTYGGADNREIECIDKRVTIRAQSGDRSACVVECGGDEDSGYWWLRYEADPPRSLRIEGITVIGARASLPGSAVFAEGELEVANCVFEGNGGSSLGGAVYCNGACTITDSRFENNSADYAGGAVCLIGGSARIEGCTFVSNTAEHEGGAVDAGGVLTMAGCTIVGNQAFTGAGIFLNSAEAAVERTILAQNLGPGSAVGVMGQSAFSVVCSDVWGNAGGDWVGPIAGQAGQAGNIALDPEFCVDNPEAPYELSIYSPCNAQCGLMGALEFGCPVADASERDIASASGRPMLSIESNPTIGSCVICFTMPAGQGAAPVHIGICDATGRALRTLVSGTVGAGIHRLMWDGSDSRGRQVGAGVYFCSAATSGRRETRRIIVLR
jgi:predicted outer membrane repeat protein